MTTSNLQMQKSEWRKKSWSIPDLLGSKQEYFSLVSQLVILLDTNEVVDVETIPALKNISTPRAWREYAPFLKGIGFVSNHMGLLTLTDLGIKFKNNMTPIYLAEIMHSKFRLFGELLDILLNEPSTVQELDSKICELYNLNWANCSNTRKRLDWLEILGLVEGTGSRKWKVSQPGRTVLTTWNLITPEMVSSFDSITGEIFVSPAPTEIEVLLQHLRDSPDMHKKRNTYNIWAPSPNRIENLRTIMQFSLDRVTRADLFQFISDEFNLKTSSAESMLPFLKASGFLEEVGRNIYITTPAAKAWCESGNNLDFIRILHSHMRFVGEAIKAAENDIVRNDFYAQAKLYGLNTEKVRWIAGFLLEAGLMEEPQYLHLKSTQLGKCFVETLPLDEKPSIQDKSGPLGMIINDEQTQLSVNTIETLFNQLHNASHDPMAEGKASGVAFEESIANVFQYMGFDAKRIGGSGDTDVIVKWKDDCGNSITGIVDGKSKSSGSVSHSDISDVAIDTHKEKNNADFVAIVGPGFSGDTIKNHARKKKFALITDSELTEIARASRALGLSLQETALLFEVPDGLSLLEELMSIRQRELDIITLVVSTFGKEQEILGSLSARDLYLLLRTTEISPTLEELLKTFDTLSQNEIGILSLVKKASSAENTTYVLRSEKGTANRLRALASAIEKGVE